MNICLITPGFGGGGAEVIAVNAANYYSQKGHSVLLISFGIEGPIRQRLSEQIELLDITPRSYLSLFHALKHRRKAFDHTISFIRHTNISAYLARLFRRLKTQKMHLLEVNTFDQQQSLGLLSRVLQNFLLRLAYNNVEDVIAVSNLVRKQVVQRYGATGTRVLGNPCLEGDELTYSSQQVKQSSIDKTRFVSAGRLHVQKDFETMIRAFSKYIINYQRSKDTLSIFGEGPERQNIERLIKELNMEKNIKLLGFVDDLAQQLNHFDVFLMASKYEGFGNVFVLAMAAGLPIIARRNTGGPDDLINSNTGLLFEHEDSLVETLGGFRVRTYDPIVIKKNASFYTIENICEKYLNG